MILNVMPPFGASITGDFRVLIYEYNMFIKQANSWHQIDIFFSAINTQAEISKSKQTLMAECG